MQHALPADKLTLPALEATLALYLDPARARQEIPVLRAHDEDESLVHARAARLAPLVDGEVEDTVARGGGPLPLAELASHACAIDHVLAARS